MEENDLLPDFYPLFFTILNSFRFMCYKQVYLYFTNKCIYISQTNLYPATEKVFFTTHFINQAEPFRKRSRICLR